MTGGPARLGALAALGRMIGLSLALALASPAAQAGALPAGWRSTGLSGGISGGLNTGLSAGLCDRDAPLSARQHDRLLQVAAWLQQTLKAHGSAVAVVARSGTDLRRFGQRYSHAGLALREAAGTPWGIRQLYYACDEGRPRVFDQGLAGFLAGTDDLAVAHVSVLLLPDSADTAQLAHTAAHRGQALALLGGQYSANAHAHSTRYQNCNQWLVELMAAAWHPATAGQHGAGTAAPITAAPITRPQAQQWLHEAGYQPTQVDVGSHAVMALGSLLPHIHLDDHPEADRLALKLRVSLPESIARFVAQRLPGTRHLELCHTPEHALWRLDGPPLPADCKPAPHDPLIPLQP